MHLPVLLQEVIGGLVPKQGEVILDATVGGGGHSEALCRAMGGEGKFICLDEDADAIRRSRERLTGCGCEFHFVRTNFRKLDEALEKTGVRKINRALFDLGVSSFQLGPQAGGSGRGFSFLRDEPLLMTFAKEPVAGELTAERIVNEWDRENIETILRCYGEERAARRIAGAIVAARAKKRITRARELAEVIERAIRRRGKIHPATKTFQALRIAVNDELRALQEALPKAWERLERGGRVAVISFQSIEDRAVKRFFKERVVRGEGRILSKKPITPGAEDIKSNPRARSAKLRIMERKE